MHLAALLVHHAFVMVDSNTTGTSLHRLNVSNPNA